MDSGPSAKHVSRPSPIVKEKLKVTDYQPWIKSSNIIGVKSSPKGVV
jgi:hypothetical protein